MVYILYYIFFKDGEVSLIHIQFLIFYVFMPTSQIFFFFTCMHKAQGTVYTEEIGLHWSPYPENDICIVNKFNQKLEKLETFPSTAM